MEYSTPGPLRTFRVSNVTSNCRLGSATASGKASVELVPVESIPPAVKKGMGSTYPLYAGFFPSILKPSLDRHAPCSLLTNPHMLSADLRHRVRICILA